MYSCCQLLLKVLYSITNVFGTEVLINGTIFLLSTKDGTAIKTHLNVNVFSTEVLIVETISKSSGEGTAIFGGHPR